MLSLYINFCLFAFIASITPGPTNVIIVDDWYKARCFNGTTIHSRGINKYGVDPVAIGYRAVFYNCQLPAS